MTEVTQEKMVTISEISEASLTFVIKTDAFQVGIREESPGQAC